ncbi:MAG: UvrB/UvrC motif-containing protein [Syntrophomonadaceae bacterium]|nr:UvrB/UvrC motif-containing protein [Syntrophomonadaceae bacterium]
MLCNECNQKPVAVQFTQMVNGEMQQLHLCAECAAKKGMKLFGMSDFSLPNLLGSLFGLKPPTAGAAPVAQEQALCPRCGSSMVDIRQTGKLGCAECFISFGEELAPLISHIHGNAQHTGKIPSRCGGSVLLLKEIEQLKLRLQEAVVAEHYEQAAEIRDSIKALEAQMA